MNILITSVGRRSYLLQIFKEAMTGNGLLHAGNCHETYTQKIADRAITTPLIEDEGYISFLLDYCKVHNITAVIPLIDLDVFKLGQYIDEFKAIGTIIIAPDANTSRKCFDKYSMYLLLCKKGFCTPETFISLSSVNQAIQAGDLAFPLMLKPRWGYGSLGIQSLETQEDLCYHFNSLNRKIAATHHHLNSGPPDDSSVIVQAYCSGTEYGLDVFNDLEGGFLSCVPKKKLGMRSGETECARLIENEKLLSIGKSLSQALRHPCNIDVDIMESEGHYHITDINCRFGGQYPFSHLGGVNFPRVIIQLLKGEDFDSNDLLYIAGVQGVKEIVPQIIQP